MSTTVPPTDPWAATDHDPTAWDDRIGEHHATPLTDPTNHPIINHDAA